MSQTASASAPEPNASPIPAGQHIIIKSEAESYLHAPQPGPVPGPVVDLAGPTSTPTAERTATTAPPESTVTQIPTNPIVSATPDTATTALGPVATPNLSQSTSSLTPTITRDEIQTTAPPAPIPTSTVAKETTAPPETTNVASMSVADSSVRAAESNIAPDGAADIAEPMNALTSKFTDNEWAALKELRAKLPDTLAKAFPDDENARSTPVTIWGLTIDPNNLQADARVSVILMKFLRARNLSINNTCDQLIGTLRWRESFNIKAALEEDFPPSIFENLAHISGSDKEGRLVVYNIYGGNQDMKAVFGDVQRFIRWRVALMEKTVMQLDFTKLDQMIQVHDYEGVSLTNRDANSKAAATEATNIFQNHYPEMLYKKFFVNVPTLLNWIFWLFKPLISANTLAKMSVVGTGKHAIKKALSEYISPDQIPARYGGEGGSF